MTNIIWLLPILCLSASILYCSVRLVLMYKEELYIQIHQILKKLSLWKTDMGRRLRLKRYSCYYVCSVIASIVISIAVSATAEKKAFEEIRAFVERLSIVEVSKLFCTVAFAWCISIGSVLMSEFNSSKEDSKLSKSQNLLEHCLDNFFLLIGAFFGFIAYKDYFFPFRAIHEWISSPGRIFQLCLLVTTIIICGTAIVNNLLNKQKDLE